MPSAGRGHEKCQETGWYRRPGTLTLRLCLPVEQPEQGAQQLHYVVPGIDHRRQLQDEIKHVASPSVGECGGATARGSTLRLLSRCQFAKYSPFEKCAAGCRAAMPGPPHRSVGAARHDAERHAGQIHERGMRERCNAPSCRIAIASRWTSGRQRFRMSAHFHSGLDIVEVLQQGLFRYALEQQPHGNRHASCNDGLRL